MTTIPNKRLGESVNLECDMVGKYIKRFLEIKEHAEHKKIPVVEKNTESHQTAFTVSIDAEETTTGISAQDRAVTVLKLLDPNATDKDFRKPGHLPT